MSRWRWVDGVSNGTHVPPVDEPAETDTVCDSEPEPDDLPPVELARRDLARHWREGRRSL